MSEWDKNNCKIKRKHGMAYVISADGTELVSIKDHFSDQQIWEIFEECNDCYYKGFRMGKFYKSLEIYKMLDLPKEMTKILEPYL